MTSAPPRSARSASTPRSSANPARRSASKARSSGRLARSGTSSTRACTNCPRVISRQDTIFMKASRSPTRTSRTACRRHSRIRSYASSSKTSCASARSSVPNTPGPSSRDRKSSRPPQRVPGGEIDEPARARCDDPAPSELTRGIEQFNAGEFFEQHETLELLWRDTRAPVRGLYHGILQVGGGFHHWRNGNFHGESTLLEEGIERLRPFARRCHGVEGETLIDDENAARERLIALGAEGMRRVDIAWVDPC